MERPLGGFRISHRRRGNFGSTGDHSTHATCSPWRE